ncbi:glutaredoxin family protein [Priestia filamentosa]|nr:glutaredoxin family protein [Priestia filamentosa]
MKIILYSKKGCHLCDIAKDLLMVFQKKIKYEFF